MGRVSLAELPELVGKLSNYMFRLETLDTYADDDALIQKWKSGEDISDEIKACTWSQVLFQKVEEGIECSRVHVVPDSLSDYLRFEIFGYYPVSSKLGEQIYILSESHFEAEIFPLASSKQDFLLLDDRLFYHSYDKDRMLEYVEEQTSPKLVKKAKDEMDALIAASLPLSKYTEGFQK